MAVTTGVPTGLVDGSYSAGANLYNTLKTVYASDKMYRTFNRKRVFGNLVERKKQEVDEGLEFKYNIHTGGTSAGSHLAESAALLGAEAQRSGWLAFNMKTYTHEVNITGQAKYANKRGKGAVTDAWKFAMKGAIQDARDDFAISHYTPQSGLLCKGKYYASQSTTVFKVDNPRRLRVGQTIAVAACANDDSTYSSVNDNTVTNGKASTAISSISGDVVTVATALDNGPASWNFDKYNIADYGCYNVNEWKQSTQVWGLEDIIFDENPRSDNATVYYGGSGSTRATYDWAKGRILDIEGQNIDHDIADEARDLVEVSGNGEVGFWLTTPEIMREIKKLHVGDKRYSGRAKVGDGWFDSALLGGMPVYADKFCTPGVIYGIDPNNLWIAECKPFGWEDDDGSVTHRMESYWAYQALLTRMWQIVAIPNCHVAIKHVAHTSYAS